MAAVDVKGVIKAINGPKKAGFGASADWTGAFHAAPRFSDKAKPLLLPTCGV
jgi:hypothetical protein